MKPNFSSCLIARAKVCLCIIFSISLYERQIWPGLGFVTFLFKWTSATREALLRRFQASLSTSSHARAMKRASLFFFLLDIFPPDRKSGEGLVRAIPIKPKAPASEFIRKPFQQVVFRCAHRWTSGSESIVRTGFEVKKFSRSSTRYKTFLPVRKNFGPCLRDLQFWSVPELTENRWAASWVVTIFF